MNRTFVTMRLAAARHAAVAIAVLAAPAAQASSYKQIFSLDGSDGANPAGGLIEDKAGNLYGMAQYGGEQNGGTVFELSPRGVETTVYSFSSPFAPHTPYGNLFLGRGGALYGTTSEGGNGACGAVFRLGRHGAFRAVYQFPPDEGSDGCSPLAGVIEDKQGNILGTTYFGGINDGGTVFRIAPDSAESILHAFAGNDGSQPNSGLILDGKGNLYGTAQYGGTGGSGTVFKLAPDGSFTVLYSFTGGADGAWPNGVMRDKNGNLFGTTGTAGACQLCGTVFEVAADGTETTLYSFMQGKGGYPLPAGGLVEDSEGNLYGTTSGGGKYLAGYVFKLTPGGTFSIVHDFKRGYDGNNPAGTLLQDKSGNIYGTTYYGGRFDNGAGTVFRVTP